MAPWALAKALPTHFSIKLEVLEILEVTGLVVDCEVELFD